MTERVPAVAVARRPPLRRPGLFAPLLLSVGTSVVLLLIIAGAELLARWCAPDYLVRTRGFHVFSETYGWAPRKGASVVIDGKRVTFNARGFRGRELPISKAGDRTRVVVLGDSIAFGLHVSDEETFTHLLDARDNGIEAANLAVQGYGPGQELLTLMREGLRLDPVVVVLAFCLANDFAEAVLPVSLYDGRTPKPRFRLVGDRLVLDDESLRRSAWQRVHQWLADYSHLSSRASALVRGRILCPRASMWRAGRAAGCSGWAGPYGVWSAHASWAVVVGIDAYRHSPRLSNAADDARDVQDLLLRRFLFKPENVTLLLDSVPRARA